MEAICGGRAIKWWASCRASSRAQGGQFHAKAALTADGAVSQIPAHVHHHHTEVGRLWWYFLCFPPLRYYRGAVSPMPVLHKFQNRFLTNRCRRETADWQPKKMQQRNFFNTDFGLTSQNWLMHKPIKPVATKSILLPKLPPFCRHLWSRHWLDIGMGTIVGWTLAWEPKEGQVTAKFSDDPDGRAFASLFNKTTCHPMKMGLK